MSIVELADNVHISKSAVHRFCKKVGFAGFNELKVAIAKELVKVDRFFPSSKKCSKCGKIKKELKLSERVYRCTCGNEMDRDRNAAINIREEARRMLSA